jgi:hypothetical protein
MPRFSQWPLSLRSPQQNPINTDRNERECEEADGNRFINDCQNILLTTGLMGSTNKPAGDKDVLFNEALNCHNYTTQVVHGWNLRIGLLGNDADRARSKHAEKLRPNYKHYTKIPTWILLGSGSWLRGYSPATGLNHG